MEKSQATLIRRHELGETSWIVHWCTDGQGLVKTVAKGARGAKSPFSGRLDLFYQCEIVWAPARRGDLHHLREVSVVDSREGIARDYGRTLAAAYFVALIELVAERETPIPELQRLLVTALDWLTTSEPGWRAIERFERRLALMLGILAGNGGGAAALLHHYHRLPAQRESLRTILG